MSFKDEFSHGSPLDHEHCQTCVQQTCKVKPDHVTSCDIVSCPRGCQSRYHECKGVEHLLLCPEDRVQCINKNFGCPLVLPRKNLSRHLSVCPASVIFCNVDWYRYNIHYARLKGKNSMLQKKTYADCGQLDTALAMRDHRMLVDKLQAPPQPLRHLKTPLKEIYSSEDLCSDGGVIIHNDVIDSRWDTRKSFLAVQKQMWRGQGLLPEPLSEAAASASSALDSQECKDSEHQGGPSSSNASTPGGTGVETNCTEYSSDGVSIVSGVADSSLESNDGAVSIQLDKQESLVEDGQALDTVLSLSLGRDYLAKDCTRFTFMCAQELRRDEFSHHFSAVHIRIHPDLNNWMEQRCPLAYLGCPFSFRRFRPCKPGWTICHSWLSESFGITSQSLQADPLHRIPDRLLPLSPETAACEGDSSMVEQSSEFVRAVEQQKAQTASAASQQESESAAVASSTTDTTCLSDTDQTPFPKDDFSSMLDSFNLDNVAGELPVQGPSVEKRKKYNLYSQRPSTSSGQNTCPVDIETRISCDDQSNQTHCDQGSTPAQHQNELKSLHSQISNQQKENQIESTSQPLSSSSMLSQTDRKRVMYTAISARSCVRVDHIPVVQLYDEKISTPVAGLTDLPFEILRYLTQYLDSFSLYNLSLVSHAMREVCGSLLQERGVVSLIWEKQKNRTKASWQVVGKRWSFSASFDPVESWTFTGSNPISNHLLTCPYNQDRLQHSDKFSLIPFDSAPLDVQIRDMLQKRLQERRDFRGWIIRSNFDRDYVGFPRPNVGPFADLLVALGGTLPP